MDNNELLFQVLAAMQEQTETLTRMVDQKLQDAESRINIKIENDVTKRLDSLTDGYKLNVKNSLSSKEDLRPSNVV